MQKSRIKFDNLGMGLLAAKPSSAVQVSSYYYGFFVYTDLSSQAKKFKIYEDGFLNLIANDFEKWAYQMANEAASQKETLHKVWVVPVPFCATKCIINPRYFDGNIEWKDEAE